MYYRVSLAYPGFHSGEGSQGVDPGILQNRAESVVSETEVPQWSPDSKLDYKTKRL